MLEMFNLETLSKLPALWDRFRSHLPTLKEFSARKGLIKPASNLRQTPWVQQTYITFIIRIAAVRIRSKRRREKISLPLNDGFEQRTPPISKTMYECCTPGINRRKEDGLKRTIRSENPISQGGCILNSSQKEEV
jgi:hypothetical protein